MTSGMFPYSALLGLTVDTCCCQSTSSWVLSPYTTQCLSSVVHVTRSLRSASFALFFIVKWWIMDPVVDSRPRSFSAHFLVRQRIHAVRQFTEFFIFYVILWITDPQVDSRPALFQRLLGSTVDTSICVSLRGWSSWSRCTSRCFPSFSSGP